MSKFNIFTIDLLVILLITVATGVYALLLKFLQKNSLHVPTDGGGGLKGFLNNVKKKLQFSCMEASLRLDDINLSLTPVKYISIQNGVNSIYRVLLMHQAPT